MMEDNKKILKQAEEYQKNKQWQKAIKQYEILMKNSTAVDDYIVVNYAKCLKLSGNTKQAEELLKQSRTNNNESEKILVELFRLYDSMEEWEAAKNVSRELIYLNSKEAKYHFLLGRAYSVLRDDDRARKSYIRGLESKHSLSMREILKKVQSGFINKTGYVETEYITIDGFNNYGGFIHTSDKNKYFTKISRASKGAKREELFYREICEKFPVLKEVTPKYIDSQMIDGVSYLTMEMIDEDIVEKKDIREVVEITQKIGSINYEDLINDYPNPDYAFQMRNKPTAIAIFFTKIHKRKYNENLFFLLYKLIEQKQYPKIVADVIKQLETLIMDNNLYYFISPNRHFSLVHRDFTNRNIKYNKRDDTIKVFDWAGFSLAPHFITLARYFSSSLTDYKSIQSFYLNDDNKNGNLSLIEKIFFLYSLILLYILRLKEKKIDKNLNKYILPAVEDLERLVEEFMQTDFKNETVQMFEEKNKIERNNEQRIKELELKIELNEQKNKRLQENIKKLNKEKFNIINSKSWRLTKPLRKIMEKF